MYYVTRIHRMSVLAAGETLPTFSTFEESIFIILLLCSNNLDYKWYNEIPNSLFMHNL